MRRIKWLTLIIIFLILPSGYVNAASVSVKSSTTSIVKGNNVTITATISDSKAIFFTEGTLTCTGAGVNKSASMSWDNTDNSKKSKSFQLVITPNQTGKVTCTTTGVRFTGGSSSGWSNLNSNTVTINVVKPREKSTNNNLKSLSVEGYNITPTFNRNNLEYTVNVESNIEKVTINAAKEDGYASLNGTGEKTVQEGDNKFEIKVTSETGKSKVYTVNVIVKDSNPIVKTIEEKDYTVIKRTSALTKPDSFEATTVLINEVEIPAFYNEITKITLIGLKDDSGSIYLYKYDAKTDSCTKFETLTSKMMTVIFKDTDKKINNYTKTTVTIDEIEYNVYQNKNNKDYVLIYGTLLETGDDNWYLYNIKEKSLQTYMSDIIDNMEENFETTLEEYKIVLLVMAGISLLLLLIIIIQIITKSKMKKKFLKRIQLMKEKEQLEKLELERKLEESKKEIKELDQTKKENKEHKKKHKNNK